MSLLAVVPRMQCALNHIRPAAMAFDDVDFAIQRGGRRRAEPKGGPQPASGWQPRGELVRYDSKSRQLVPYLSGISAMGLDFSRDG